VGGGFYNTASGSYSFAAGRKAKADHTGAFVWADGADAYFASTGNNQFLIRASGGVGIGTSSPEEMLHVQDSTEGVIKVGTPTTNGNATIIFEEGDADAMALRYDGTENELRIDDELTENTRMVIERSGKVGIGTTAPLATTHLRGSSLSLPSEAIHYDEFVLEDADAILGLYSGTSGPAGSAITFGEVVGGALVDKWSILRETTGGGKGLRIAYGTNKDQFLNPTMMYLNTSGRVVCSELQLTGGSDVAEPFEMKEPNKIEPGMVVVIDPDNPGKLKISTKAYDRCVAGIVSGAGGIKPGVRMMSDRSFENNHHVALTGRAYALCDASFGSIEPGDLLTTSPTSGYAMKVTDYRRAQGAILGKAMTKLDKGQGLVSVLVTLQ